MAEAAPAAPAAAPAPAPAATESVIAPATPAPAAAPEPVIAPVAAAPAAAAIAKAAEPKAGDPPPKPTADEMKKLLTDGGMKPEEVAKLVPADLETKYGEAKAAADHKTLLASMDITVPEGVSIDQPALDAFKGIVADPKLSPKERAQQLFDLHVGALRAAAEAPIAAGAKMNADWQTEVKADAEIGGQNLDKVRATIAKAITDVGGDQADAMFKAFHSTGAGNNPAIVRIMYRLASLVVEGDHVGGNTPAETLKDERVLSALYPSASKPR